MSLLVPSFREFWKTTEAYRTLLFVFCLVRFAPAGVTPVFLAGSVVVAFSSFMAARTLYKKNRGMLRTGFTSGEFYASVICDAVLIHLFRRGGISPDQMVGLVLSNHVVYCVCRGIIKSVGVKTQMVIR